VQIYYLKIKLLGFQLQKSFLLKNAKMSIYLKKNGEKFAFY
jgi:hypothetical protein